MYERHVRDQGRGALRSVALLAIACVCAVLSGAPAASPAAPLNDNFVNARDISLTPSTGGSNAEATAEASEPEHGDPKIIAPVGSCAVGVSADGAVNPEFWSATFENPPLHSVWFKWTAPATSGCLTLDTFGSSFDTVMSVYTGTDYGNLTLVAGNDEYRPLCAVGAFGVPTNSQQSCVKFTTVPGATYYIAVDSGANQFGGTGGSYALNWSLPITPPPMPDLAVNDAASVATANVGEPIPYVIQVANQGSAPAPGSTLVDSVTGASITSMSTSQGTCTPPTCSLGTIAPGQNLTVTVIATASTAGVVTNSATVATTTPEVILTNNTSSASPVTVSAPKPDIAVSDFTAGTPVNILEPILYRITVVNQGFASAPNVTLVDTATGGTIQSMSTSQGSCTPPSCSLGTLAPGASATVNVVVVASSPGTVTNTATVATTAVESNPDNNVDRAADVTVKPLPVGCIAAGKVHGNGHWELPDGSDVHVQVVADCEPDAQTNTFVLKSARFTLDGPRVTRVAARTGDVSGVTITGNDVMLAGTVNGQVFRVTLHEGQQTGSDHGDQMEAQYGSFDTATLAPDHFEVNID